jgi:predicted pyridoxine 5'-phosphate oxidase superfamily flavin-nucleotide-binding protein
MSSRRSRGHWFGARPGLVESRRVAAARLRARVADGKSLIMPDRPGNNRLDTLRNDRRGAGEVGFMFMIPASTTSTG